MIANRGLTTSIMIRISTISRICTIRFSRSLSSSDSTVVRSLVRREDMSPDEWVSRNLMGTRLSLLCRLRLILWVAFLETTIMFLLETIVAQYPNTYSPAMTAMSGRNPSSRWV